MILLDNVRSLISFCFDWEVQDMSNIQDSVSSAIQTPRISLKILHCASYFQLSSQLLDIPRKHCLSWYVTWTWEEIFCIYWQSCIILLYRHTDNFLKISDHFPKISEESPKLVEKPHKFWRLPNISKDNQKLCKTSEEDPKMFWSYTNKSKLRSFWYNGQTWYQWSYRYIFTS